VFEWQVSLRVSDSCHWSVLGSGILPVAGMTLEYGKKWKFESDRRGEASVIKHFVFELLIACFYICIYIYL
jgi:hypothetical protein